MCASTNVPDVATLGVPDVPHHDGSRVVIRPLRPDGVKVTVDLGRAFPFLKADELAAGLPAPGTRDDTARVRAFRSWVPAQVAPRLGGDRADQPPQH